MSSEQKTENALQRLGGKRLAVAAARLIVGVVFILSGLAKSIDLWGTIYKIQDYAAVWHWDIPFGLVMFGAATLALGEFMLGAFCFLGCCRRVVPYTLAAIMAVMLPFTLYIWIKNPVADCGCFGDMIVLSNGATFLKNVVLTALIVPLVMWNRLLIPYIHKGLQWVAGAVFWVFIVVIAIRGYNVQPIADFRSFPVGTNLAALAEEGDNVDYEFVYKAPDGREETFTIDALPDSTWTFVERRVLSGSEQTKDGFYIFDSEGENVAAEAIPASGDALIVTVPDIEDVTPSHTYQINELYRYLNPKGIPLVVLLPAAAFLPFWEDLAMPDYPVYVADVLQLKELVRGHIGVVWLSDGVILNKTSLGSLHDLNGFKEFINAK